MRRVLLAPLLCVPAFVLAACGSSDQSVGSLLHDTFSSAKAVKSGRVNAQLDANIQGIQGLNGPVRLRLNGPFQSQGKGKMPRFDFTLGITAAGQTFTAGGVSTGDKGYVRFQGHAYLVSDQLFKRFVDGYLAAQRQSEKNKNTSSLGAIGVDPRAWLKGAHKVGEEDLDGTKTIHLAAGIDVPRLLDDVNRLLGRAKTAAGDQAPKGLTPAQRREIQDAVRSATVDVFTGKDDKLLRRLDVHVALQKSGKIQGGDLRFQLQLDALNQSQDIQAPSNAKPLDQLLKDLGAQLPAGATGALGSSGGSSSGGSGSGSSGSSAAPSGSAPQAYLDCLQKAGGDVRAAQRCADLL